MGYQAALIAMSAIAVTLLVPPFIWHARTVNVPLITLLVWLLLMDIKIFVDAIIWGGEDFIDAFDGRGYCDVMVKLQVGANVGISSSVAGVMFNLYRILKADRAIPGLHSFKKISTDLAISLATPIVVMALNYLVQSRRYAIFQYSGCQNSTGLTWVTVVIYSMWLVIWSLVALVFAALVIWTYYQKRKDVRDILRCTNSGLNLVRFARLLSFCCVVILVMFPLSLFIFCDGISSVEDSYNFEFTHSPAVWNLISYVSLGSPYYITWIYLALSYAVFIVFGLGSDAIEMYKTFLNRIGLSFIVNWFSRRSYQQKIAKADKLVAGVLDRANVTTPNGATQFDIEMQRIMEEDEKSPASTQVSNVFADKNALVNNDEFKYLGSMDELDEEDIKYINMLYKEELMNADATETLTSAHENEPQVAVRSSYNFRESRVLETEVHTPDSPDFSHKVTHNFNGKI